MILCDSSPLIALLNRRDRDHELCHLVLPTVSGPLMTTWPCFTEAMHFLGKSGGWAAQKELWRLERDRMLVINPLGESEKQRMSALMAQYRDTPMDLADASLVALAEALNEETIFTLDSDFRIYRLGGSRSFTVIP